MPNPTPGFDKMDRAMAERNLRVRAERIKEQVKDLPTEEVLQLAVDLYKASLLEAAAAVAVYGAGRINRED